VSSQPRIALCRHNHTDFAVGRGLDRDERLAGTMFEDAFGTEYGQGELHGRATTP
jgi:hypothetical protein